MTKSKGGYVMAAMKSLCEFRCLFPGWKVAKEGEKALVGDSVESSSEDK